MFGKKKNLLKPHCCLTLLHNRPPLTPTSPDTSTPPMTPLSPGAPPGAAKHTCNHLHTIGGPGGQKNICSRCNQKKWPLIRKLTPKKSEQRRSHHGEVTVLSVGRWVGRVPRFIEREKAINNRLRVSTTMDGWVRLHRIDSSTNF